MYFDSHNHIQGTLADGRFAGLLERSLARNVTRMHACATGASGDWPLMQRALEAAPQVICGSFGVHPWYCGCEPANWKRELERLLDSYRAGIGEVGLEGSARAACPVADQLSNLRWQLDLALERGLPVSIHCVKAWPELTSELRSRPSLRWMLHGCTASAELVRELSALGGYFSYGSALLDVRRSAALAKSISAVPPERLLLETDSPDGWKGQHGEGDSIAGPERVGEVCLAAAQMLGRSEEELAAVCTQNAKRFFDIG